MRQLSPPRRSAVFASCLALGSACFLPVASADSVAQVATAKRISAQTVTLLDPQGRVIPDAGAVGNTLAKVGDILTFTIQFTPVPNGAYRGMGGYITDYIPPNTEVVGARIVDRDGHTVSPHRGGLACDGYGPRGANWDTVTLVDGSMTQLYADTGIFYSDDPRTARSSHNPISDEDEPFLSLKNGLEMPDNPSGAGQFDQLLSTAAPYFAHNEWDLAQVVVYGPANGNAPEHVGNAGIGYGSPVAGPDSWYQLENTIDPPGSTIIDTNSKWMGNVGPWNRIRATGSQIGRRGQGNDPPTAPSIMPQCFGDAPTRVGVPAQELNGTLLGWDLSPDNPLPVGTNAVRFALGELVVGDEYYAEISLRVKSLPLDPDFGDVNCAEVAGGDASSRAQDGGTGGKDYLWRYFVPAPACVSLDLLFENRVDKVLALANSPLVNTIVVKNLATTTQTNVVVRDCYISGDETFVPAGSTGGYTLDGAGTGCPNPGAQDAITWTIGSLAPGQSQTFILNFTGKGSTSNQAVYTSDALPAPGFVATAYTTIGALAVMRLSLEATPDYVPSLPEVVHYQATITNVGTATATTMNFDIALPDDTWTYQVGSALVDGATAADPVQTSNIVSFESPPAPANVAPGASVTLEFDVDVPNGTAAGEYFADLTSWVHATQDLEDSIAHVAPVAILTERSDTPSVNSPILQGASHVSGSSDEATGSAVTVYVNDNPAGAGTVTAAGTFNVTVPELFAGQEVSATVEATSELESFPSAVVEVVGIGGSSVCSDGDDNDGDGETDFPDDPGCSSAGDPDETDVPQCADGLDNDGNGDADFPDDQGCSSYADDSEDGEPACGDGADNDGDGEVDSDDPGCSSATDTDENDIPACADGVDNDDDGDTDFPADIDCASSLGNSEGVGSGADGGNGIPMSSLDASAGGGLNGGVIIVQGDAAIPDLGSVPFGAGGGNGDDAGTGAGNVGAGTSTDGGCSCRVVGSASGSPLGALLAQAALAACLLRRRRRS